MLPALREKPLLRRRAESPRATAGTHTASEPAAERPKAVAPASSTAKSEEPGIAATSCTA